jgi:hypothetical protein
MRPRRTNPKTPATGKRGSIHIMDYKESEALREAGEFQKEQ